MNKGQAEIAWRESMVLGRSILETLAGKYLPTHITLRSAGSGPAPAIKAAKFLREWAAALDGVVTIDGCLEVPVLGTIGEATPPPPKAAGANGSFDIGRVKVEVVPPLPTEAMPDTTVDGCPADKVGRLPLWLDRKLDDRDVMSTKELAWHLGMGNGTVTSMARKGCFPADMTHVLGNGTGTKVRLCFYRDAARRYLLERRKANALEVQHAE